MISVVIPCRNGAATIARQLGALADQRVEPPVEWEVVVVDNASTDGSADVARAAGTRLPRLVVTRQDRPGINAARNAGVRAAAGDVILLCDADDEVRPGWLSSMAGAFAGGATLVAGPLDRGPGRPVMAGPSNRFGWLGHAEGANCGFRRSVFDELGGFDERYAGGGDEVELFWRAQLAGHELTWVAGATVAYAERGELRPLAKQHHRYGIAHAQLYRQFAAAGMPPRGAKRAVGSWLSLARRAPQLARSRDDRRAWVRAAALASGRLRGSVRHRTVYL